MSHNDEVGYLQKYFGEEADEYKQARFFLMRQVVHMEQVLCEMQTNRFEDACILFQITIGSNCRNEFNKVASLLFRQKII